MAKPRLFMCVLLCLLELILEVPDGHAMTKAGQGTCVIGSGISGLATARYLQNLGVNNFTVFEASRHIGGTWRFDPHVGEDEDGVTVFTSMYKYLRTNTPRQTMEFAGYAFPEDTPSYPSGTCYYKYLKQFVKEFDLKKYIQVQSLVTRVSRTGGHWTLSYTQTDTKENMTQTCEYVVVATGYLGKPKWPKFEGIDVFKGKMIHSHDYKEPDPYKNRRVLLVGAGPSGLDLATHLVDTAAKLVHSHHLAYNQPNFPKSYVKKPDVRRLTANGVEFEDGSFEEVDDVIFCTGFTYDHKYLDETTGVTLSEKFVLPLYKQVVNIRHPTMMFLGIGKVTITRLLDVQAEYTAAIIASKFKLPPSETMLKSWLDNVRYLQSIGKKIIDVNLIGNRQDNYFEDLATEAGITRAPPVLTDIRDFNAKIRLDDLLNYRDYDYNVTDDKSYVRWYNPRRNAPCSIED